MAEIWLEAAINGPWGRGRQPGIPVTTGEIIADGIAAAKAGAAIIHLHVYDDNTGRQTDDWQVYARAIEGIRAAVDVIVCPTIPLAGSGFAGDATSASGRFAHLDELGRRGLVEWGVIDPGSVNFSARDDVVANRPGFVYTNPEEHIREGLAVAARHRLHPSFAIYEPGFTRAGAALAACHPALPVPIYRLMFSDDFMWGFPPRRWALDAHLALLAEAAPDAPVMIAGLRVDVSPLIAMAVNQGVHVRAGLEDAAFGEPRSNRQLVEHAARLIGQAGGMLASATAIRAAMRRVGAG
jgi:3-keto-5-aminohexanoate cleavage enzyme